MFAMPSAFEADHLWTRLTRTHRARHPGLRVTLVWHFAHSKVWFSDSSSFGTMLGTILVRRMGIWHSGQVGRSGGM